MRYSLMVLALVGASASTLDAQIEWVGTSPRIGLVAGLNQATLVGPDAEGFDPRTGAVMGAMLIKPFSTGFSLESGVWYSMKGGSTANEFGSAALQMDFVEVPLLVRYDIRSESDTRPYLTAGAALSVRARCDIEASDGTNRFTLTCEEADRQFADGTARFQRMDGSLVAGAGVAFDVGGRILTVGVRYAFGMTDFTSDAESKHRVKSFAVTFEWPLRRP